MTMTQWALGRETDDATREGGVGRLWDLRASNPPSTPQAPLPQSTGHHLFQACVLPYQGQPPFVAAEWDWRPQAPVCILRTHQGAVLWHRRPAHTPSPVWRPISPGLPAFSHNVTDQGKVPFPLSLMKHALPDGLRAGEGFRHNGYDLSPLVDRHGFFQGMTYNRKHALVRTWTRPHQMLLKEIPRWQLQLDSRYMVLPTAHGTVISYHDLATLANEDGVVGTDLLFAAVTLVTQAPAHKAGLPPADSHRTTVCEPVYLYHGATAVEEWNTSILAVPVQSYQRVYLIVHVPLHWLLVEIFPRQNKAFLLDPLQTYGHQHLSLVTRLLTSWLTRLRASPWVIEHQRLPQQPAGSSMCGPFVTMYAACRRRDWEPPPQIDAAGLRRWMAEVLRDDAIPLHRGVCKHCGASLLRPGPDLLDNMGKCEPGDIAMPVAHHCGVFVNINN